MRFSGGVNSLATGVIWEGRVRSAGRRGGDGSRTNSCTTDCVPLSNGGYPKVARPLNLLGLATLENLRIHEINIRSMDQKAIEAFK